MRRRAAIRRASKEVLGDTWAIGTGDAPPSACGYWRASVRAREQLRAKAVAYITTDRLSMVEEKVLRCR
jgi:hypothetical protein